MDHNTARIISEQGGLTFHGVLDDQELEGGQFIEPLSLRVFGFLFCERG